MHVVVSGGSGRTGSLVYKLLKESRTPVKALVRDAEKARSVLGTDAEVVVADISNREQVFAALEGATALVVLTSAVPKLIDPGPPPSFGFAPGGMPEEVDYNGAVNQIDAARECGVQRVVFIGSMGSTDLDNPLNKLGNGNILVWKRKAEQYLIDSGVPYTVINPAGLVDREPGEREVVFGKGDDIFKRFDSTESAIARADVARIVVAALEDPNAANKAVDIASHERNGFVPTKEFTALFNAATAGL